MLLTLSTRSFAHQPERNGEKPLSLLDLPEFAIRQLKLRGLNVVASMLVGWSLDELDRLRDRADKVACPCLVLIEDSPLLLGTADDEIRHPALQRVRTLAVAANRLGCNSLCLHIGAPDTDEAFEIVAREIRDLMPTIERHELNLLIAPHEGITQSPDRLTDLIKRVGGFRIGSMPSFAHAAATGQKVETLRKLAPYAGAIHATIGDFDEGGEQQDLDLVECVYAIRSVGFLNTLAIDFLGEGDPIENIERARTILEEAIEAEIKQS